MSDLSGQDVARKLLILAREIGLRMDIQDVSVSSLVPNALRRGACIPTVLCGSCSIRSRDAQAAERCPIAGSVMRV